MNIGDKVKVEAKVIAVSANGTTLLQTGSGEKFYVDEGDIEHKEQPTVFDFKRVISELERKADYANDKWSDAANEKESQYWDGKEDGFQESIEIIKGGIE